MYTVFFLLLTMLILTNSQASLYFTLNGLNLWFEKMVPSLLPFMILSGIMVRMGLTEGFASLLHPLFSPLWKIRKNLTYAIIMGFLCGFPMGARVACDLLKRDMITEDEAEFLLAFCNNIGPVYFCSFVIPLLHRKLLLPYLFGMYGIPFLYGLFLRHTVYRHRICPDKAIHSDSKTRTRPHIAAHSGDKDTSGDFPADPARSKDKIAILEQVDDAIWSGIQSILMLGGYMILFNLLNLVPLAFRELCQYLLTRLKSQPFVSQSFNSQFFHLPFSAQSLLLLAEKLPLVLAPVLEITGGLGMLKDSAPFLTLVLLPFGGLSCIAQTYSMIRHTSLSIQKYLSHKLILTGLTFLYYIGWAALFPRSFLK